MFRKLAVAITASLLSAAVLSADFSYQESTKITGGALSAAMNVAGIFSKSAREPQQSTVSIKGDRMARRGATRTEIIDLGAETITTIDLQKKTYSVMTFAQLKQIMEETMQKMNSRKKDDPEINFKVSAHATGNTKSISGFDAKEMVVKIAMEGTDQKSGQKGGMVVTSHVWVAPNVPGFAELRDFQRKMAAKLNWTPGGSPFMANPEVAKGMVEAAKEINKLDGAPVLQIMSMGPEGSAPPDGATPQPSAQQQQQARPSLGGALGGALGGKFGLGRKKNQEQPQEQPKEQPPASGSASASLLDMTTEYSNFLTGGVDASTFEIPAGFKKVEPDVKRR
jgi:hypothetical protein